MIECQLRIQKLLLDVILGFHRICLSASYKPHLPLSEITTPNQSENHKKSAVQSGRGGREGGGVVGARARTDAILG